MSVEASIFVAVVSLVGNAFFVGAEFSLVAARRTSIELRALEGSWAAQITLRAMEQVSLMLAGAQLGITLCSLVFGAVGETLATHALEAPLTALGVPAGYIHPIALIIALVTMVYVHVLIGEMVPKNLALAQSRKLALFLAPLLYYAVLATKPVIVLLNGIANSILRIFGITPKPEVRSTFTRDEVAGFIRESHREGLLSHEEVSLLSGTLELESRTISPIIVRLDQIVYTSHHPTAREIEELSATTGYSRFPVPSIDGEMAGYIHLKDILQIPNDRYDKSLPKKSIRHLSVVKYNSSLRDALVAMQRSRSHIAQVNDDNGRAIGLLMLEDVFEELIGSVDS